MKLSRNDLVTFINKDKSYNYSYGVYRVFSDAPDQNNNIGVMMGYIGFQYSYGLPTLEIKWFKVDNLHKLSKTDLCLLKMEMLSDSFAYLSMVINMVKSHSNNKRVYLRCLSDCFKSRKLFWKILREKENEL